MLRALSLGPYGVMKLFFTDVYDIDPANPNSNRRDLQAVGSFGLRVAGRF